VSQVHLHPHAAAPTLTQVGDNVFAFVQLDGSWGLNNAGVLLGGRGVTVIDTAFTAARARRLAESVRSLSPLPIRTLINTHHHGDHTYGNFVFPEATIIAHERCRQAVIETGLETRKFFPGVEWGRIEIVPPFVTFEDRLNVYIDDARLELISMGPAHTTNDIAAWMPEQRILFAGDLLFHGGTPFVVMGSVAGSLAALERLRSLNVTTIIPGHGSVCGPEVIDDQLAYLDLIQELARAGVEAGRSPLEVARQTDLGRFGEWTDRERLVGNLHRAYAEIAGRPLGVALPFDEIVEDMMAYNDGMPLRCLA